MMFMKKCLHFAFISDKMTTVFNRITITLRIKDDTKGGIYGYLIA